MSTTFANTGTLGSVMFESRTWTRQLAIAVGFSLLVALSAQIVIPHPFSDVPVTGQTFAVLLTGALLGARLGALTLALYLLEGALGLPFFHAGHGGFPYLLSSPTAGYLWAYPFAAFLTGTLAERGWDKRFTTAAAAMMLGSIVILTGGWAWRTAFLMPAGQAFMTSVVPFLAGDVITVSYTHLTLPTKRIV